jgi:NADH-quinone oxidoreductase subunit H
MDLTDLIITFVKTVVIYLGMVQVVPIMLIVERRGAALIQDRPGPNRVGPFGLFQPIADVIKMMMKEVAVPKQVNKALYILGPFLVLFPASLVIAALPFGDFFTLFDKNYILQVANIDVGILYVLAIGSLGIYGILFGGWASNNKFSLIGAMRSSSQIISYEIPLGLAACSAVLWYGTFSLREMVTGQEGTLLSVLPNWGIFYQPLGFLLFFIAAFAETNRLPFDLPESEAELVAGFHTEYGPMDFGTFFMAEYMNMATMSGIMVSIYFGGWHLPWISDATLLQWLGSRNLVALIQVLTVVTKIAFFMLVFVWVRWTIPRFRFDQLMRLAWKNLIPLGLINLVITALVLYFKGAA